eukprot:NODE_1122_length_1063_cov_218.447732_g773_i0.p1 GENE.NODE_1122_length_1063_cov_218.447732_g773_i0~~NODE_1122_length_1063_cov_218.447732_g773_i0.p1  ORF type:complete len:265 (+),score=125.94 NODE_1122_length_1063_cov_218.447732_g773_i0:59-796(+)
MGKNDAKSAPKLTKAKERKLKRKEEIKMELGDSNLLKSLAAIPDALAEVEAFRTFERNGLKASLRYFHADDLPKELQDWAFNMVKTNMYTFYQNCPEIGGWNDRGKREEMFDSTARFIIAFDGDVPLGYVDFRFDMDFGRRVIYCYEMHIEPAGQRKGLGRHIMTTLELLGRKLQLEALVLTVFLDNLSGIEFYKRKLKYTIDESSPINDLEDHTGFEILSKPLCPRPKPAGGCHSHHCTDAHCH